MKFIKAIKPTKKHVMLLGAAMMVGALMMPAAKAATVVVDVRTPEEYQVDHPNGAINIPYSDIVAKIASQGVTKSDTIKVYSRGGGRAEQAKSALQQAGYSNVEVQK